MPKQSNKMIEISEDEYYKLQCAELKLDMLEAAGVDNWDWYGVALNPDDGSKSYDELCEELKG